MQLLNQSGPGAVRRTALTLLAVFAAISPWMFGPIRNAQATHAHGNDGQHIQSIHYYTWEASGTMGEDICPQSYDSNLTTDDWRSFLQTALYGSGWDGTGSARVDNYFTSYSCESYDLDLSDWIDIRASVIANTSLYCGSEVSCVVFRFGVYYNGSLLHNKQGQMWIKTNHVSAQTPSRNATINHEFGHILGLYDPFDTDCDGFPYSIMHQFASYGCSSNSYIE